MSRLEELRRRVEAVRLDVPGFEYRPAPRPVRLRPEPPPAPIDTEQTLVLEPPVVESLTVSPPELPPEAEAAPAPLSPEPPAPKRSIPLWPAGVAALAGLALWLSPSQPGKPEGAMPLPYSETTGLAARGDLLASMDAPRLLIYTFDEGGVVRAIDKLSQPATALTWSEAGLWTAAPDGQVCLHAETEGFPARSCYVNAERRPSALHWDGSELWLADERTETLQAFHVGEALTLARQHSFPGLRITGLQSRDGLLWVLDAGASRLARYELRTLAAPVDQASLAPWTDGARPSGFLLKDDKVFLALDRPAGLRIVPLEELEWVKP